MRLTKIVATLGPASAQPAVLRDLIRAGVDVFRLNFSHGTHDSHRRAVRLLRAAARAEGRPVAILQDLCGPKIRVGAMQDGGALLRAGQDVTIVTTPVLGTPTRFSSQYPALPQDVRARNRILLDDGNLELQVRRVTSASVVCQVVRGGLLKSHKGMNLPGVSVSAPSVTPRDLADLQVGLDLEVDFVALSFVRQPEDLRAVRRMLKHRSSAIQVIAKIERPEAIAQLDGIIDAADGVMVARGDLGVEMDVARVPLLQKEIIRRANAADKYVITATQMLESMIHSPAPTRAEVCDVANAILDGSDAVMLSGETAAGEYPVETVCMMDRVARETESHLIVHRPAWDWTLVNPRMPVLDALGHATLQLCRDLAVKAVVTFSRTGGTALFLSKSRPAVPIIAMTRDPGAFRRMRLFWGVEPVLDRSVNDLASLRRRAGPHLARVAAVRPGDLVVLVYPAAFKGTSSANTVEVVRVGRDGLESV